MNPKQLEAITLGAGCFWCIFAVFKRVRGVSKVLSGYSAGKVVNPTYKQICGGDTGHAEVVEVLFDPNQISLDIILRIYFNIHDPTQLNRQGDDIGTQYRSTILYRDQSQKEAAEKLIAELTSTNKYPNPIVTTVEKFEKFYPAEDYHQDYYDINPTQGYCRAVVEPKLKKFLLKHNELLNQ